LAEAQFEPIRLSQSLHVICSEEMAGRGPSLHSAMLAAWHEAEEARHAA
jgi:hypothetical protein